MKRLTIICAAMMALLVANDAISSENHADPSGEGLVLIINRSSLVLKNNIDMMIHNAGAKPVRVLKEFRPHPVFFNLNLVKDDGSIIFTPGAGKISFGRSVRYVELDSNEFVGVSLNLDEIYGELAPGKYKLNVVYHNQYGQDCFKGRLQSNTIEISISEKEMRQVP